MPIADKKKIQTLTNITAEEVAKLKAVADRLDTLQAAFLAHNPDVTGTPLDGHVAAVNTWIADVRAVADNTVANGFVANVIPSHRGMAMGAI